MSDHHNQTQQMKVMHDRTITEIKTTHLQALEELKVKQQEDLFAISQSTLNASTASKLVSPLLRLPAAFALPLLT